MADDCQKKYQVEHRVIDVSGDGGNNYGILQPYMAREKAEEKEITINALSIEGDIDNPEHRPDYITKYYKINVLAYGGFPVVAESFEQFGEAIRNKLITEISYNWGLKRQPFASRVFKDQSAKLTMYHGDFENGNYAQPLLQHVSGKNTHDHERNLGSPSLR
jgi:hypothetical protein